MTTSLLNAHKKEEENFVGLFLEITLKALCHKPIARTQDNPD